MDTVDHVFPTDILEGLDTALILFAAAFGGAQDAAFVAEAGLQATCIDIDPEALRAMYKSGDYPDDWVFLMWDAFDVPRATVRTWDLVTLDPFTNQMDQTAAMIDGWCRLAERFVVLGTGSNTHVDVPDGWRRRDRLRRSGLRGGVFWDVLERTDA